MPNPVEIEHKLSAPTVFTEQTLFQQATAECKRHWEQLEGLKALHPFPGAACSLLAWVSELSKPILLKSPSLAEVTP